VKAYPQRRVPRLRGEDTKTGTRKAKTVEVGGTGSKPHMSGWRRILLRERGRTPIERRRSARLSKQVSAERARELGAPSVAKKTAENALQRRKIKNFQVYYMGWDQLAVTNRNGRRWR